jgi:hypothetical protein
MATVMFKVAIIPEGYNDENEDKNGTCCCELCNTDAELTSRIDNIPASIEAENAK